MQIKLTDISYLILSIILFTVIVFSDSIYLNLYLILLTYINLLLLNKFNWRMFLLTLIMAIPTWLSFYIASFIYHADNSPATQNLARLLTIRLSAITITSLMFTSAINFEELILFFMQKLRLSVVMGYAILSAINALASIKQEYIRISLVYRMRFSRRVYLLPILLPLVIGAVRHAYYKGLSLECRGLNTQKTFIHQAQSFTWVDSAWLIINVVAIVAFYML